MIKAAIIEGQYRYALGRRWGPGIKTVNWVMLNPSTADAEHDDPTIRRCMGFAVRWGYDGILVTNLFAYRTTNPRELFELQKRGIDVVGPENFAHVTVNALRSALVVCAWGNGDGTPGWDHSVVGKFKDLRLKTKCLGFTDAGHPRHPLYVHGDTPLQPFTLCHSD